MRWSSIKETLKNTGVYKPIKALRNWWRSLEFNRASYTLKRIHIATTQWRVNGCPIPPPSPVKWGVLLDYACRYKTRIFVETGTCHGQTTEAMSPFFERIYSIELNADFYRNNIERLKSHKHIILIWGDSGKKLPEVLSCISEPALFWLDAHYSGGDTARGDKDTPILDELHHILESKLNHIVIIDDARCFGSDPAYPSLRDLNYFVHQFRPDYCLEVASDIIRLTPGP